jgi:transposase
LTCDNRRTKGTLRPQLWVGIDVGKTSHQRVAVDASGKVVWTQKVTNQQRVIEQLIERAHGTAEDVPLKPGRPVL